MFIIKYFGENLCFWNSYVLCLSSIGLTVSSISHIYFTLKSIRFSKRLENVPPLHVILSSKHGLKCYLSFLVKETSVENLEFFSLSMRWRGRLVASTRQERRRKRRKEKEERERKKLNEKLRKAAANRQKEIQRIRRKGAPLNSPFPPITPDNLLPSPDSTTHLQIHVGEVERDNPIGFGDVTLATNTTPASSQQTNDVSKLDPLRTSESKSKSKQLFSNGVKKFNFFRRLSSLALPSPFSLAQNSSGKARNRALPTSKDKGESLPKVSEEKMSSSVLPQTQTQMVDRSSVGTPLPTDFSLAHHI